MPAQNPTPAIFCVSRLSYVPLFFFSARFAKHQNRNRTRHKKNGPYSCTADARRMDSIPVLSDLLRGGENSIRGKHGSPTASGATASSARQQAPSTRGKDYEHDHRNHDGGSDDADVVEDVPFNLCLTHRERDSEVRSTVEAFSLNRDQARLLWHCARWLRPSAPSDAEEDQTRDAGEIGGEEGIREGGKGQGRRDQEPGEDRANEEKKGESPPVVLVHGVFGAGKSLSLVSCAAAPTAEGDTGGKAVCGRASCLVMPTWFSSRVLSSFSWRISATCCVFTFGFVFLHLRIRWCREKSSGSSPPCS